MPCRYMHSKARVIDDWTCGPCMSGTWHGTQAQDLVMPKMDDSRDEMKRIENNADNIKKKVCPCDPPIDTVIVVSTS